MAFASNTGIAAQLGTFQRQNLDIGYLTRRNSLIEAVTLEDVRRAGRRLFDPARLTVMVAGSSAGGPAPQRPRPPLPPETPPTAQAATAKPVTPAQTPPKPVDKPVPPPPSQPSR